MKNKVKNEKILYSFFVIPWCVAYILFTTLPIVSKYNNQLVVFTLNILFVTLVIFFTIFSYSIFGNIRIRVGISKKLDSISKKNVYFILRLSSILSMLGCILILFDRIVIRGINYSGGLRAARYQWIQSAKDGLGGSIFSILGNLWIPFSYCALFFCIFHWEKLNVRDRWFSAIIGVSVPILQSLMNGGRSNILLMLVFGFCILILRKAFGLSFLPDIRYKYILIMILLCGAMYYANSLFYSFETDTYKATTSYLDFLGGKTTDEYTKRDNNELINLSINLSSYLFHGNWSTEKILNFSARERDGNSVTFRILLVYLQRFGLHKEGMVLPSMLSGGQSINLPGSLYYDFGILGILAGSLIIGWLFGRVLILIIKRSDELNGNSIIYIISILMILVLSPIEIAYNFGYFIFIVYAIVAMNFLSRLIYGKKSWITMQGEN